MSRQACHLVSVLAEILGHAFGGLALHYIDDLLKTVVITIQVLLFLCSWKYRLASIILLELHDGWLVQVHVNWKTGTAYVTLG